MKTGKAVLGVLAGIAAGAVIGMLFAPEKGSVTRKNISKQGDDLTNALTNRLDKKFAELLDLISKRTRTPEPKNDSLLSRAEKMVQ